MMHLQLLFALAIAAPAQDTSPIAEQIAAADAAIDAILALPAADRTFENTVVAIDDVIARFFERARMPAFMAHVSTDAHERDSGRAASAAFGDWFSQLNKRKDLFEAVQALAATEHGLTGEDARLLEHMLRDFKREGMDLSDEQRARLLTIDQELNQLGIDFNKNIADDNSAIYVTKDELKGVPDAFIETLPRIFELYVVPMQGSVIGRVLALCEVETTRLKVGAAYNRRANSNKQVLDQLLALRSEKAHLLGYEHIADYRTEPRMAQNAETVWRFYDELKPKLRVKARQDFEEFQAAKREHLGDPEAELRALDVSFYRNWLQRERYAVDSEKLREYFPLDQVTAGLFDITQELYGVTYKEITDRASSEGRPVWHADVRLFEVWDNASEELLGEFYLDLHPREGKYTHAAQFPLVLRKQWGDGKLTRTRVALVCNFTKPTPDKPSLLSHSEVETYFHEFGHCLHSIFNQAKYAYFAGTGVAQDFVEALSQMFENWVWNPEVLARFAKHYETGEALPVETLRGLIAAKNLGSGLSTEAQVYLGTLDMSYHTDPDGVVDQEAIRDEVYAATRMFEPLPNIYGQASFGHLTGYHAGYYGYLWSLVYAQDMFSRFDEQGIMNPEVGASYRHEVLSRGGTRDELDMVRDFLGREPNSDAFLEHLGLQKE